MYKTNTKTLKDEKKADLLKNLAPKEWHIEEFHGVLFYLIYIKLGDEEAGNYSVSKYQEKDSLARQKTVRQ